VNLVVLLFGILLSINFNEGISALIVGILFISLSIYSISRLKETFGKELNYMEELS
jgi:hypothetical protein